MLEKTNNTQHWILKSEPSVFGIDHLAACVLQTEPWDGVRNFQARNFLRKMKKNDLCFFYHSNCEIPGIVGIIKIVKEAYPDATAFNPESKYFDPQSSTMNIRWYCVDVQLVKKFSSFISLKMLRENPNLHDLLILRQGNRLSVTPITPLHWKTILEMQKSI